MDKGTVQSQVHWYDVQSASLCQNFYGNRKHSRDFLFVLKIWLQLLLHKISWISTEHITVTVLSLCPHLDVCNADVLSEQHLDSHYTQFRGKALSELSSFPSVWHRSLCPCCLDSQTSQRQNSQCHTAQKYCTGDIKNNIVILHYADIYSFFLPHKQKYQSN